MLPSDLSALIFDMDGLMVDSEPLWWSVERALAAEHGKEWSDALAQQCVGTGLPNTIATMRCELGIVIEVRQGVDWLVAEFIKRKAELELKPGCEELVAAARAAGVRTAVASSSTPELIDAVLNRFSMADQFDAVVSGESVPNPKPAPDIFVQTAKALGAPSSACVVLEDSLAGVQAGRAASMAVIAVPEREPETFSELTAHIAKDLFEARGMLAL